MLKPNCYTDETINSMRINYGCLGERCYNCETAWEVSLLYNAGQTLKLIWKLQFGGMSIVDAWTWI